MDDVALPASVRQILARAIEGVDGSPTFRRLLRLPLEQPGRALANGGQPRWPALVFACAQAAAGDKTAAGQVAAAVEASLAASDVLDELEDGDISPVVDAAGPACALNAATALLLLSHDLIATLDRCGVPLARIPALQHALLRAGIAAAAGQHADLAAEGRPLAAIDDALEIARRKAGAIGAGAAYLGAALGTDDVATLALYEAFGCHYGTMAQLANDLSDAHVGSSKSDHQRGKQTLPRVFGQRGRERDQNRTSAPTEAELEASGAMHFTWVVIELERQRTWRLLDQLQAAGQTVEPLAAILG